MRAIRVLIEDLYKEKGRWSKKAIYSTICIIGHVWMSGKIVILRPEYAVEVIAINATMIVAFLGIREIAKFNNKQNDNSTNTTI